MTVRVWIRRRARIAVRTALIAGLFPRRSFDFGTRRDPEVAVVMCLWNRPTRLDDVLRMLDRQDVAGGVRLYLWNNNRQDHQHYVDVLRSFTSSGGALAGAKLVKTPHNLGSIARFYWVRQLDRRRSGQPVIIIDDDENFSDSFVRTALDEHEPKTVKAWWAWKIRSEYWDRVPAGIGDQVDHVGPGGSVLSSSLVADRRFFTQIPDRFRLLDDVWLSWFAKRSGYRLAKLPVDIEFVMDETNQHHGQGDLKREFYSYLTSA